MLLPSSSLRFLPGRGHVIPSFSLVVYLQRVWMMFEDSRHPVLARLEGA